MPSHTPGAHDGAAQATCVPSSRWHPRRWINQIMGFLNPEISVFKSSTEVLTYPVNQRTIRGPLPGIFHASDFALPRKAVERWLVLRFVVHLTISVRPCGRGLLAKRRRPDASLACAICSVIGRVHASTALMDTPWAIS